MEGAQTPSLAIVGAGRAGSALAIAAHEAGYRVAAVASRRGEVARSLADTVGARGRRHATGGDDSRRHHAARGARRCHHVRRRDDRRERRPPAGPAASCILARDSGRASSRRCAARGRGRRAPSAPGPGGAGERVAARRRILQGRRPRCPARAAARLRGGARRAHPRDRSVAGGAVPRRCGPGRQCPARAPREVNAIARGRGGQPCRCARGARGAARGRCAERTSRRGGGRAHGTRGARRQPTRSPRTSTRWRRIPRRATSTCTSPAPWSSLVGAAAEQPAVSGTQVA